MKIPDKAALDLRAYYGTCRLDGPLRVYVVGWGQVGGNVGHLARPWIEDERRWGDLYCIRTTSALRAMPHIPMPEGAIAPEEPKK